MLHCYKRVKTLINCELTVTIYVTIYVTAKMNCYAICALLQSCTQNVTGIKSEYQQLNRKKWPVTV